MSCYAEVTNIDIYRWHEVILERVTLSKRLFIRNYNARDLGRIMPYEKQTCMHDQEKHTNKSSSSFRQPINKGYPPREIRGIATTIPHIARRQVNRIMEHASVRNGAVRPFLPSARNGVQRSSFFSGRLERTIPQRSKTENDRHARRTLGITA